MILSPNGLYQAFENLNKHRELEEQSRQDELQSKINGDYGNATTPDFGFKNLISMDF